MASLFLQALIAERYGLRLGVEQLAEVLGVSKGALYNQVSAGTCPIPTYVDQGKRWADFRDVAEHFDTVRQTAQLARSDSTHRSDFSPSRKKR